MTLPFHQRFDIEVSMEETRWRFLHRMNNLVFRDFFINRVNDTYLIHNIVPEIANALGVPVRFTIFLDEYVRGDFYCCLQVLEVAYKLLQEKYKRDELTELIKRVISLSEVDLGISWKDGVFIKPGAKLLDSALVNEPLQWLSEPKYNNVLKPFEKGLQHYMKTTKRPELLADVVTDMYEALEALAKIVTGRPRKDLSANRELFVQMLELSEYYKKMLKDYISYANDFRHAAEEGKDRPIPSSKEVEAFVYTTGLFIRLAISEESTIPKP